MTSIIHLIRPHQWTKNLILFAGLIFSRNLNHPLYIQNVVIGFCSFCLLSSFIYVINDYLDQDKDKNHPEKKHRPLASGRMSNATALGIGALCLGLSLALALALPLSFLAIWATYLTIMVLYALWLKHMVILDVFIIATGFICRAQAGVKANSLDNSPWFLLCTLFLALFLGFCKRYHELQSLGDKAQGHREVLKQYREDLLNPLIAICATLTILTYAVYTLWPSTVARFGAGHLEWTVIFVLYGVFRYLYLVYACKQGGSPDRIMLRDRGIIGCIILWLAAVFVAIY